ncbi:MAG TPA: amino acid permease [Thermoplasmataceae archaeon]|nr:amino acid permease [Thermoplasmataceae archaeon]
MTHVKSKGGITLRHGIAIYVASVLGGGILVLPGLAADTAGPASIIAWVVLSVASYPLAYTFSRLALRSKGSGGIYSFSLEAFGTTLGNGVGWLFLAWVVLGGPAVAVAAGSYLSYAVPISRVGIYLVAFLLLLTGAVINYIGIRFSANFQLIIIVMLLSLLGISIITAGTRISDSEFVPFFTESSLGPLGTAIALVIWAYFGYENVPNMAGDFSNLQKDMSRSVTYSVIIIGVLYTSLSIVTVGTGAYKSGNGLVPFAVILDGVFGVYGRFAAGIIAIVAIFSAMNAYTAGVSRVIQTVSKNGGLPKMFSGESEINGAPGNAIILVLVLSSVFLSAYWFFNVSVELAFLVVSGIGVVTYIIGSAAGIKLLELKGWRKAIPWVSLAISAIIVIFIGKLMIFAILVITASLLYTFTIGHMRKYRNDIPIFRRSG